VNENDMVSFKPTSGQLRILVCHGSGCIAKGADKIIEALKNETAAAGLPDIKIDYAPCFNYCQHGPIISIEPEGYFYIDVKPADVSELVQSHIVGGNPVERLMYKDPKTNTPIPLYKNIPLFNKKGPGDKINPENIQDYMARGGYNVFKKALQTFPTQIIEAIKKNGLKGRAGAVIQNAPKWELAYMTKSPKKSMICDFTDNIVSLAERDPHAVLEGIAIALIAIGAHDGYIFCNTEKALAVKRLEIAVKQMAEQGFMGQNIQNSNYDISISLRRDAPLPPPDSNILVYPPTVYAGLVQDAYVEGVETIPVIDEETCMVDTALANLNTGTAKSCGKCTPCRDGIPLLVEIVERIVRGEGQPGDIDIIQEYGNLINRTTLCNIPTKSLNPVLANIRYFRNEWEMHVNERKCPTQACKGLVQYYILKEKCQGCGMCARNCPVKAITGDKRMVHIINQAACIKCGTCLEKCPPKFKAIVRVSGEKVEVPDAPVPITPLAAAADKA